MNDDTLTTALDRMATALEPPTSADELINARRTQLRRRRRVTTGLTAASVLAILATGGVVVSSLGNADPAPDGVPVASDGPAPANAVDDAPTDISQVVVDVQKNDSPWQCVGGESELTLAEVQAFRDQVLGDATLGLDPADDKLRAYIVIPDDRKVVYQLDVRPTASDDFEIVKIVRCKD